MKLHRYSIFAIFTLAACGSGTEAELSLESKASMILPGSLCGLPAGDFPTSLNITFPVPTEPRGPCTPYNISKPNVAETLMDDHFENVMVGYLGALETCYATKGVTLHGHLKRRFPYAFEIESQLLQQDGDDLRDPTTLMAYLLEERRDVYDLWQADLQCPVANLDAYANANFANVMQDVRADVSALASRLPLSDFDGDGRADYAVWRQGTTGEWLVQQSSNDQRFNTVLGTTATGETAVPGDYDGDGRTDVATWNGSTGNWTWISSRDGSRNGTNWGASWMGDLPVASDYDGDGRTDYAVWRGQTGQWFIKYSATNDVASFNWGTVGDVPVPGDYDNDGKADFGIFRPSTNQWYVISPSFALPIFTLGDYAAGDRVAPGDYDGDGRTDAAVWRPSTGQWTVRLSSTGSVTTVGWGASSQGDIRNPSDFDGDGATDISVWRGTTAQWFHIRSSDDGRVGPAFGAVGDFPIPAAYLY